MREFTATDWGIVLLSTVPGILLGSIILSVVTAASLAPLLMYWDDLVDFITDSDLRSSLLSFFWRRTKDDKTDETVIKKAEIYNKDMWDETVTRMYPSSRFETSIVASETNKESKKSVSEFYNDESKIYSLFTASTAADGFSYNQYGGPHGASVPGASYHGAGVASPFTRPLRSSFAGTAPGLGFTLDGRGSVGSAAGMSHTGGIHSPDRPASTTSFGWGHGPDVADSYHVSDPFALWEPQDNDEELFSLKNRLQTHGGSSSLRSQRFTSSLYTSAPYVAQRDERVSTYRVGE